MNLSYLFSCWERKNVLPSEVPLQGLEAELRTQVIRHVDLKIKAFYRDCFDPNEGFPERIQEHLNLAEKGVIVSTGTERSFFDLLLCPEERCEGLVIRDINPRIKAYVDFNILLLRISENQAEYVRFTSGDHLKEIAIRIIKEELLPDEIKLYYLSNLDNFAKCYFLGHHHWRNDKSPISLCFKKVRYDTNTVHFEKLQKYAREGNIVATIGSINDLNFLKHRKISVVDVSNIDAYAFIDLQGASNLNPRVISTSHLKSKSTREHIWETIYTSHPHAPLTADERIEFQALLKKFKYDDEEYLVGKIYRALKNKEDEDYFNYYRHPHFHPVTLRLLKSSLSD